MAFLLKIALVPLVVWLASVAGRRYGHRVTGWISGLPLIAGPISVFLALGEGVQFATDSAATTLQVSAAIGAHCLAFAYAGRRFGWIISLALAYVAFLAASAILSAVPIPPAAALAVTVALLLFMGLAMPRPRSPPGPAPVPNSELAIRVLAALAIAAAVTLGAAVFGPRVSGILLAVPITGTVLPSFALALYGADAATRLLAGFISGLFSFAAFHFAVAVALPPLGIVPAYAIAVAAALGAAAIARRIPSRGAA